MSNRMLRPFGPLLQIVVAPPYETCSSLHNADEAGLQRVKKVVSAAPVLGVLLTPRGVQLQCVNAHALRSRTGGSYPCPTP